MIASDYLELPEVRKGMMDAAKIMQEIWSLAPDDVREFMGYERLGGDFAEPWPPIAGRAPLSKAFMDDGMEEEEEQIKAYGNKPDRS
jgi:hypothetical protein